MSAENVQENPNRPLDNGKKLPAWREVLANFFLFATFYIGLSALWELHRAGQPIREIIIDGVGMAALYAPLVYLSRRFVEK
jgi:hypothetical protein